MTHLLEGFRFASQGKGKPVGVLVPPHPVRHGLPVRIQEPQPLQHISMPCPTNTSQALNSCASPNEWTHPVTGRLPLRDEKPQPLQHIGLPYPADTSQDLDTHKQPALAQSANRCTGQVALKRQGLSCMYLARYQLESMLASRPAQRD